MPRFGSAVAPSSGMDELESTIQAAIIRGQLPREDCLAAWFSSGRGQRCAGCEQRVLGTQVAVDCEIPDGLDIVLHVRCYELWRALMAR